MSKFTVLVGRSASGKDAILKKYSITEEEIDKLF